MGQDIPLKFKTVFPIIPPYLSNAIMRWPIFISFSEKKLLYFPPREGHLSVDHISVYDINSVHVKFYLLYFIRRMMYIADEKFSPSRAKTNLDCKLGLMLQCAKIFNE